MKFRLQSSEDREAIQEYLGRLSVEKGYDVTIVKHKAKRSDDQNALYWVWVTLVAKETGNDSETIHKTLARKFLGFDTYEVLGEKIAKVRSTTKLSTEEFTNYLNQVEAFVTTELDIILPHPEDKFYEQFME